MISIDHLIYQPKTLSKRELRVARLSVMVYLVFGILVTIMGTLRFSMEGFSNPSIIALMLAGPLFFIILGITKLIGKYYFFNRFVAVMGWSIILIRSISTGGLGGAPIIWFTAVPISVGFILKKNEVLIWGAICALSVIGIGYAQSIGKIPPVETSLVVNCVVLCINILSIAAVSYFYERRREADEKFVKESEKNIAEKEKLSSLGTLAGGMAHEINNPLAIIKGNINRIQRLVARKDVDPEQIQRALSAMNQTTDRISKIVRALGHLGIQSKDQSQSISCYDLIQLTLDLCQEKTKTSGITLVLENLELTQNVEVPVELSQVFLNLIGNSIDAVKQLDGGLIKISAKQSDRFLHLLIQDNGSGIPENIKDKIFDPFFTTKEIGEGMGMGLSVSRGLLQRLGGDLSLMARDPEYTTFLAQIPLEIELRNLEAPTHH